MFAYLKRRIDTMTADEAETLLSAIREGRDQLAADIRQGKEKDLQDGEPALKVAKMYAVDDAKVAFLNDIATRLTADLSVPSILQNHRSA